MHHVFTPGPPTSRTNGWASLSTDAHQRTSIRARSSRLTTVADMSHWVAAAVIIPPSTSRDPCNGPENCPTPAFTKRYVSPGPWDHFADTAHQRTTGATLNARSAG